MPVNVSVPFESEEKKDILISTDTKIKDKKDFIDINISEALNSSGAKEDIVISFPKLPILDK
jgi:hypothetical protein